MQTVKFVDTKIVIEGGRFVRVDGRQGLVDFIKNLLKDEFKEKVFIFYMVDDLILAYQVGLGDLFRSDMSFKEVIRMGLLANASRFIIAHNHIGEEVMPSLGDINVALKLEAMADFFDLVLLDSIIVNSYGDTYSMLEDGPVTDEPSQFCLTKNHLKKLKVAYSGEVN